MRVAESVDDSSVNLKCREAGKQATVLWVRVKRFRWGKFRGEVRAVVNAAQVKPFATRACS
jgi:hypothetical protein